MKVCAKRQRVDSNAQCINCGDFEVTDPTDRKLCKIATCDSKKKIIKKDGSCELCLNDYIASPDGKDCVEQISKIYARANTDPTPPPGLTKAEFVAYMKTVDPNTNANDFVHQFYAADKDGSFTLTLAEFTSDY